MAKELIISANVYEKKVAVVEDGTVTEFYVERRDENQGVVGNLYKGRVMKVLPGMQSAFVDIGLERDAFLYVSDFAEFMDDDEEVDFKEVAAEPAQPAQSSKPADDRNKRNDRRDRDAAYQKPDRHQQRPAVEKEPVSEIIEAVAIEDVVEQLAEIADERVIPIPQRDDELEEKAAVAESQTEVEEASVTFLSEPTYVRVGEVKEASPAVYVERITDDDVVREPEPVEETVPAIETAPEAEVAAEPEEVVEEQPKRGRSRRKAAEPEPAKTGRRSKKAEAAPVEAVAAEAAPAETGKKVASKRPVKKKRGGAVAEAEAVVEPAAQFERIVDEDATQAAPAKESKSKKAAEKKETAAEKKAPVFKPEPEPEWKVGSLRAQLESDTGFQRIEDESDEATGTTASSSADAEATTPFKHISETIPGELLEHMQQGENLNAAAAEGQEAPESNDEDREASVRDFGSREEFAMRRGGRSRRRGPQRRDQKPGEGGEVPTGEAAPQAAAEAPAEKPEVEASDNRREQSRRPEPQRRPEQNRRPERPGAPTISELLREGQEVLVQIAKEPIAKKGARITSHIALPGRFLVYMPTVNHVGVSRKIPSDQERSRLKRVVSTLHERENAQGGFIARTACAGISEQELHDDMRYLIRTWNDVRKKADRTKPPTLVHRDLDLIQRILRDQVSDDFSVIRVDNELEYARIVEFVNRVQPRLVNRVKLYTGNQPIFEKYNVQPEIDKAVKPRVWLKSGGYIVINQTEALVAIDVNTGKFVGKSDRLEDTITKTNLEAAKEIVRQIRLRDLGGIIVVDFIDMEERKNRQRVMQTLQEELESDRSPSKILSINDFGLLAITRKRVKQSLERTLCTPCPYCQGGGMVKSPQTMCFEILEQAKAISDQVHGSSDVMLRVSPMVAEALHTSERAVFEEIEAYFGTPITIESDPNLHQEQYDFAIN